MNKTKVLLIDDDVMLGHIVTTALTEEGYEVHVQNSLTALGAVASEFKPDIVLMDVEVGLKDGIESMPELYTIFPKLPVVVISSHTESGEVARALRYGAVAYLKKPFEIEELIAYIQRYASNGLFSTPKIKIASLELDMHHRILYKGNQELKKLTKLEFALLVLLAEHQGEIVSHEEMAKLWKARVVENHSLYNLVARLRKVLSADATIDIITSEGTGYVLRVEAV